MDRQAVVRLPGEARTVTLAGQPLAMLVTGTDTRHTSMFDWWVPAGFSTGLHVHRVQEETFFVVEGECEWQVGDRLVRAGPGGFLFLPPGVPHDIRNPGDRPVRLLMTVSPPGHEHYFEELSALTSGAARPDAGAIAALRRRYDTDQLSALTTA
ncbi:MAG TPA: cupin domain-containing protein [Crenalkalicoccus sp.]|jgi:mannose-6-phosphate isomerase-like protein (cupin superfamily)|nr:cupin domain-containing protein [Crenalkalicoccus sp.]